MTKKLLAMLAVIIGLSCTLVTSTSANAGPYPPIYGDHVVYKVTAKTNGVDTNRVSKFDYRLQNVVSDEWFDIDDTPWSLDYHFQSGARGNTYVSAEPTNNNPVYGVVTYYCTITVNGSVVSSNSGVGRVSCAY